jgi:hypothetical protein
MFTKNISVQFNLRYTILFIMNLRQLKTAQTMLFMALFCFAISCKNADTSANKTTEKTAAPMSSITKAAFGTQPDGQVIEQYTLTNAALLRHSPHLTAKAFLKMSSWATTP